MNRRVKAATPPPDALGPIPLPGWPLGKKGAEVPGGRQEFMLNEILVVSPGGSAPLREAGLVDHSLESWGWRRQISQVGPRE